MKQNVTAGQVFEYINKNKNLMENIIKLGKAVRTDYEGIFGYSRVFEKKDYDSSIADIVKVISDDYTIGRMIEILQNKDIRITLDNCIPASVKDWEDDKEYCEMELCDTLWRIVIDNI